MNQLYIETAHNVTYERVSSIYSCIVGMLQLAGTTSAHEALLFSGQLQIQAVMYIETFNFLAHIMTKALRILKHNLLYSYHHNNLFKKSIYCQIHIRFFFLVLNRDTHNRS